jgi:hypothetical protein
MFKFEDLRIDNGIDIHEDWELRRWTKALV